MSSMLTSLARNRAKVRMKKKGMRRICATSSIMERVPGFKKKGSSYFAGHWREYA